MYIYEVSKYIVLRDINGIKKKSLIHDTSAKDLPCTVSSSPHFISCSICRLVSSSSSTLDLSFNTANSSILQLPTMASLLVNFNLFNHQLIQLILPAPTVDATSSALNVHCLNISPSRMLLNARESWELPSASLWFAAISSRLFRSRPLDFFTGLEAKFLASQSWALRFSARYAVAASSH